MKEETAKVDKNSMLKPAWLAGTQSRPNSIGTAATHYFKQDFGMKKYD